MNYVALLRGINVGGNHTVEMKKLKSLCESLGFENVSTYINSGNIVFEGNGTTENIRKILHENISNEFGFDVPTLVKSQQDMIRIAEAAPKQWVNDATQRTDVAYLFPEVDSEKIIDDLPIKKEFISLKYVKGALLWNIKRENINKSQLVKLISHKIYKFMTVRNVNTARYLGVKK